MNPFTKITDMIDSLMDKAVKIGTAGVGLKIALLLGATAIIGVLHFAWHDLVYPAFITLWHVIQGAPKIFAK